MRTLTPSSKRIISLPEPHPRCKRNLTVSHSTLPFICSFTWILTLLFRGEERGYRSSCSSSGVSMSGRGGRSGLSEKRKKRATFHQAYEWRFWDRWHYSNCWKCENVLDGMEEGLLKGKNGKMSLQIIKTFSYDGSWSVNLNSKIHFPALECSKIRLFFHCGSNPSYSSGLRVFSPFVWYYKEIRAWCFNAVEQHDALKAC